MTTDSSAELRGVGVSQAGITSDMSALADNTVPEAGGAPGEAGEAGPAPAGSPLGGAQPAPAAPAPV